MTTKNPLLWRYATKLFDPDAKVSPEDLQYLVDSLVYSPSSFGLQPWHFLVVSDPHLKAKLKPISWNQPQITDCSHLFVLCARTSMDAAYIERHAAHIAESRSMTSSKTDAYTQMMISNVLGKSEDQRADWMQRQVYIALGFLLSACMHKGIDSCPMEGFDKDKYDEILGLKEQSLTAVVACPVGYRSKSDSAAALKKVRWNESDIVEHL
ncbi:NAD(P)H-dependent oxidoreductase [Candidatus Peregrinibacteria bacterium CG10_big_fil_rev_8_21_14_0_10_49_24]|nr:MAG: NAD(P)H-dependent oxidoreductase [Candidatus Peregrinibacteria bacterium CG11_big_fil_rev_8_21_14_0_20_49_14]PIR50993.1 MAG: NAD(P)H-dependent oxidoreductase [Candidatus Peregrinibacteria bacterium CG10_big_fil_rev_8_21_14_0_10_49_24]PJA67546.1 MAG: NAD(P)H-dependent oxidoreductase [Candidatus Peregrinibacteria bacterium CG_4_9_14_3_um_filter_49_12]